MRFPWATALFVATALVASVLPGGVDRLEYRHAEVAAGEWWRLAGGQLVHWTTRMTVVDLGAVAILGALLERRSRRAATLAIGLAMLVAGLGMHFLPPAIGRYRGASTVASGLFVALALDLRGGVATTRSVATVALALFFLKVGFEAVSGQAIFAGAMGPGVTVLPRAHLLGALGGVLAWLLTPSEHSHRIGASAA